MILTDYGVYLKQYDLNALSIKSDELYYPPILSSKPSYNTAYLIGSCNGLCCAWFESRLFIWNPCTRVYRELPSIGGSDLVPDIDDCYFEFGFGFDGDDYKVFAPRYCDRSSDMFETKLYSLRTNSWKTVHDNNLINKIRVIRRKGKFANKKLYWLAHDLNIVYFDLETEASEQVDQLPKFEAWHDLYLEVLRECLCLYCTTTSRTEVWILKYDHESKGESWNKLISIVHHSPCPGISENTRPTPVWMTREGEIWVRYYTSSGTYLMIYDPRRNSVKECSFNKNITRMVKSRPKFDLTDFGWLTVTPSMETRA